MIHGIAGRARRGRRFSVSALILAAAALLPALALAQPDSHLDQLRYHSLMGTWSCTGIDRTGAGFHTTLQWGFNDGGDFYFLAQPHPASSLHPVTAETWYFDTSAGANFWRAQPDPGAADPASWISDGMRKDGTLNFIRQAAESTLSRTFVLTSANHLTFSQQQGPNHPTFHMHCVRTVNDAPR